MSKRSMSPRSRSPKGSNRRGQRSRGRESLGETLARWYDRFERGGGAAMLVEEHQRLRHLSVPPISPDFAQNMTLNRYHNVLLVEESRVVLHDGIEPSYIHASRVRGFRNRCSYILTQAPLTKTAKDYWRMVWQENVQVVVCLTTIKEKGAPKADLFFPTSCSQPFRAGPLRVLLMNVKEFPAPRRVFIMHVRLYCWFGTRGQERDVVMLFYGEWPDRGVPAEPDLFLDMLQCVTCLRDTTWRLRKRKPEELGGLGGRCVRPRRPPILINCSAGVGRSATFVACQIELDRYRATGRIDPAATVRRLRDQRAGAVQNFIQHAFICRVVLEAAYRITPKKLKSTRSSSTSSSTLSSR